MKFTMNMLLTCILYCDTGRGCDQNCLQAHFTSRKLYVSLEILLFLQLSEKSFLQEIVDCASHFPR